GEAVEAQAGGVEGDRAVDGVERVRQREVPDAAAGDRRLAREDRLVERAGDLRLEIRLARAADVAHEPLKDAEVRFACRADGDLAGAEIHAAADVELRV